MIAVPEAAMLPSVRRPMRASNAAMTSAGNPWGNTGNGRSRTSPIISQWPVTESFPGDASAIRPNAARGDGSARHAVDKRDAPQAETAERREAQANLPGDVAERVAALVAVGRRVGQLADADAVEHDEDDACSGQELALALQSQHVADARHLRPRDWRSSC